MPTSMEWPLNTCPPLANPIAILIICQLVWKVGGSLWMEGCTKRTAESRKLSYSLTVRSDTPFTSPFTSAVSKAEVGYQEYIEEVNME